MKKIKNWAPNFNLRDQVIVTIGGTRGIGQAISFSFAEMGAMVVPVSRDLKKVKKTCALLKKMGANPPMEAIVDVTQPQQVNELAEKIYNYYGKIDGLLFSAGIHLKKPTLEVSPKEWQKVLDINLNGAFYCAQAFAKWMKQNSRSQMTFISSLGAFTPLSDAVAYSVSKAGVSMLVQSLAWEWSSLGIRVNAIAPGVFPTDLNKKALSDPKRKQNILSGTPMKRYGSLNELTGAAIYLASDASSFVTGETITVDGGHLAGGKY